MSVLHKRSRGNAGTQQAVTVTGQLAPTEPAYTKPNLTSRNWDKLNVPAETATWKAPVVVRGQRRIGMRYLYGYGAVEQPLSPLGTGPDVGIGVWSSEFQPDFSGRIVNAGFNDALFQAGYPGYNLGLSFKVPTLPKQTTGPGSNMRMRSSNVQVHIQRIRNSVQPSDRG